MSEQTQSSSIQNLPQNICEVDGKLYRIRDVTTSHLFRFRTTSFDRQIPFPVPDCYYIPISYWAMTPIAYSDKLSYLRFWLIFPNETWGGTDGHSLTHFRMATPQKYSVMHLSCFRHPFHVRFAGEFIEETALDVQFGIQMLLLTPWQLRQDLFPLSPVSDSAPGGMP